MNLRFLFSFWVSILCRKMTGTEYMLNEVMEPNLFVIRKQKRDSPEKVTPMLTYYILDGSIYQAPQLCNIFAARIVSFTFPGGSNFYSFPKITLTVFVWMKIELVLMLNIIKTGGANV